MIILFSPHLSRCWNWREISTVVLISLLFGGTVVEGIAGVHSSVPYPVGPILFPILFNLYIMLREVVRRFGLRFHHHTDDKQL